MPVPTGQQLPGDLVDEGKLLLFLKERVVGREPKKGKRLAREKKRKAEAAEARKAAKKAKLELLAAGMPLLYARGRHQQCCLLTCPLSLRRQHRLCRGGWWR